MSTPAVSRWLAQMFTLAGIDTSTSTTHFTSVTSTSKANSLGVPTKEILKEKKFYI